MTARHQPIRDLVDQHRDQEETPSPYELYEHHAKRALAATKSANKVPADDQEHHAWLAEAQVHATLALAAATVHTKSCGVHCHAIGC